MYTGPGIQCMHVSRLMLAYCINTNTPQAKHQTPAIYNNVENKAIINSAPKISKSGFTLNCNDDSWRKAKALQTTNTLVYC